MLKQPSQQQQQGGEPTLEELRERLGELHDRANAIQAKADLDKRDLTAEELAEIEQIFAEFDHTDADIKRRETLKGLGERVTVSSGRRTEPTQPSNAATPPPAPATPPRARGSDGLQHTRLVGEQERGRWGFAYIGEFFQAVREAGVRNSVDPRLIKNAATSWGSEGVGEDGGFAVPPDWRSDIVSLIDGEDSLLGLCDQQRTTSNQIVVPVDETAPWYSSGVRAFWLDEAQAKTQSKPLLQALNVRANKLAVLVYLSDELLEDANAMGSYVQRKAPAAIQWKVNDALVSGTGTGTPLGILNAGALITVAAESGQGSATLVAANITKMFARMNASSRRRAVWLYNQDIEPQLFGMMTVVKNVAGSENVGGGFPLYMPPGGLSSSPYGTLMGRPMYATEACSTLGTVGDIILVDMQMYLAVIKAGGVRFDVSIHVEFEKDLTAFRFVLRVGGQPWISKPITRAHSSNTLSPFVTLAAR